MNERCSDSLVLSGRMSFSLLRAFIWALTLRQILETWSSNFGLLSSTAPKKLVFAVVLISILPDLNSSLSSVLPRTIAWYFSGIGFMPFWINHVVAFSRSLFRLSSTACTFLLEKWIFVSSAYLIILHCVISYTKSLNKNIRQCRSYLGT